MKIRLIRHATLQIELAGIRLLVDPMFAAPNTLRSLTLGATAKRNPTAPLPCAVNTLLTPQAVLVTHTHFDHFDVAAIKHLSKQLPIFCQPSDQTRIQAKGFTQVIPINHKPVVWGNVQFGRIGGMHGRGLIGRAMGRVSGFIITADHAPSLYIAGDTIWCPAVSAALEHYQPEVIVVNAGAAQFNVGAPITMPAPDVVAVCQAAPRARVLAVHMEAINHCHLTRAKLSEHLGRAGVAAQVAIPQDGEAMEF